MGIILNNKQCRPVLHGTVIKQIFIGGHRIWDDGGVIPPSNPQDHIELEYIEIGSGSYWTSNENGNNQSYKISIDIAPTITTGSNKAGFSDGRMAFGVNSGKWSMWQEVAGIVSGGSVATNQRYTVDFSYNKSGNKISFSVDGDSVGECEIWTFTSNSFSTKDNRYTGNDSLQGKYYSIKEFVNSESVTHNWIPVRKTDGTLAMYDTITGTYIINQSPVAWIGGPEKNAQTDDSPEESAQNHQLLQYLTMTSGSYWESDIHGNVQSYDMEIEYAPDSVSGVKKAGIGNGNDYRAFGLNNSTWTLWEYNGTKTLSGVSASANKKQDIGFSWRRNTGYIYFAVDEVETEFAHYSWNTTGIQTTVNFWGGPYYLTGKYYSISEYENETKVHEWVPVRRNNDNVVCFYDTISKTYSENKGSGSWSAGPSV